MPGERYLRLVDFVLWVVAASAVIVTASLLLGLLVGGDLLTGKFVLFVVGFLVFGVASLLMQPSRPRGDREPAATSNHDGGMPPGPNAGGGSEFGSLGKRGLDVEAVRDQLGVTASHENRFEARLQAVGPLAGHDLPFDRRIGREYKLFVTSLVVLAVSFGMEVAGVHV